MNRGTTTLLPAVTLLFILQIATAHAKYADNILGEVENCITADSQTLQDGRNCALDRDNDGVADSSDSCPTTQRDVAVDNNGCMLDQDKDGIADAKDLCFNTIPGLAVDCDGCPIDSDKDGVIDITDRCPGTKPHTLVDNTGCIPLLEEMLTRNLDIKFDSDDATVKPQYHKELAEVAAFIKQHNIQQAEIGGHTDSSGSSRYNQRLSQRRADSVRQYMLDNFGINPAILTAVGYGEDQPIADNVTFEGKEANRRVVVNMSTVSVTELTGDSSITKRK